VKITKIKALQDCAKIWSGLAKTGAPQKQKWALKRYKYHGCPCCCYADDYRLVCDQCLLIGLWPETCEDADSPYRHWNRSIDNKEDRKKYANIIANYANKLLKKESKAAQKLIDRIDQKQKALDVKNAERRKLCISSKTKKASKST